MCSLKRYFFILVLAIFSDHFQYAVANDSNFTPCRQLSNHWKLKTRLENFLEKKLELVAGSSNDCREAIEFEHDRNNLNIVGDGPLFYVGKWQNKSYVAHTKKSLSQFLSRINQELDLQPGLRNATGGLGLGLLPFKMQFSTCIGKNNELTSKSDVSYGQINYSGPYHFISYQVTTKLFPISDKEIQYKTSTHVQYSTNEENSQSKSETVCYYKL